MQEYSTRFAYQSYLEGIAGEAIAKIPYTGKVLAQYNQNVIFLPQLVPGSIPDEAQFLQKLYEAAKKVRQSNAPEELPAWASHYFLPAEKKLVVEKEKIQSQISKLRENLQQKEEALLLKEQDKILFTATGKPLEKAVLELFQKLNLDAKEGRPVKEDGILEFAGKTAVWEVKGIKGSATIAHSRQLVSWTQEYAPDAEEDTKGILIVNAYLETELNQRTEAPFPHNVIQHATKNENCLITTTQLLGLYYQCQEHPEKKEGIIQSLFDTVGLYPHFTNWSEFITQESVAQQTPLA